MAVKSQLSEKMREGVAAVLPIALIVMVLCFTVTPVPNDLMLAFVIGTVMLIAGMGLFTYGAEASMTPIGNHIGAKLTKSRKLLLILSVSFRITCCVPTPIFLSLACPSSTITTSRAVATPSRWIMLP